MSSVETPRYDGTTILLHWVTAILVAVLWVLGQVSDWFSDGPANTGLWSSHVVLGFALAGVLVWRVAWRLQGGRALPAADGGALHALAKATHYGLYLLLGTVVALGVLNAFVRGYPIYGLFRLPQVGDRAWRHAITDWHGLAANVALALASFHAAAALVHHYVLRDGLVSRMAPARGPGPGPAPIDPRTRLR